MKKTTILLVLLAVSALFAQGLPSFTFTFSYPTPNDGYSTHSNSTDIKVSSTHNLSTALLDFGHAGSTGNLTMAISGMNAEIVISDLSPGTYYYYAYGCDQIGNCTATETRTLTILADTTPPTISLSSPTAGYTSTNSTVRFVFTPTDDRSTVLACSLYAAGSAWARSLSVASGSSSSFTLSNFSANTNYNWYVSCTDGAGNTGTSETRNFRITDSAPQVTLISPSNGYSSTQNTTYFSWSASDAESQTLSCNFYIGSALVQGYPSYDGNSIIYYSANFNAGTYSWKVECTDGAGNKGSATSSFSVASEPTGACDTTGPLISLWDPSDNLVTSNSTLMFDWYASDASSGNVTCSLLVYKDGNAVYESSQSAHSGSTLYDWLTFDTPGTYKWNVSCSDECCNFATSEARNFTIINQTIIVENCSKPFDLYLISPGNGEMVSTASVPFVFRPDDKNGDAITATISVDSGSTHVADTVSAVNTQDNTYGPLTLASGLYGWNVSATDENGCDAFSENWYFAIDHVCDNNTDPSASISLAKSILKESEGSTARVSLLATDPNPPDANGCFVDTVTCSLFLDNGILPDTYATFTSGDVQQYALDSLPVGTHSITARCTDNEGAVTTSNAEYVTVINDTTPSDVVAPLISLILQPDGHSTQDHTIELKWNTYDNVDDVLECNVHISSDGEPVYDSPTMDCNTTGTCSAWTPTLNLCGTYMWNVSCVDNGDPVGWSENREFTITTGQYGNSCENRPPTVVITDAMCFDAFSSLPINLSWMATDDFTTSMSCQLYLDDAPISTYTVQSGVEYILPYSVISAGLHAWNVTCSDGTYSSSDSAYFIYNPAYTGTCGSTFSSSLVSPPNEAVLNRNYANLTWLPMDSLFTDFECGVIYDGGVLASGIGVQNGSLSAHLLSNILSGTHDWSTVCWDACSSGRSEMCDVPCAGNCSNVNSSETWNFTYDPSAHVSLRYNPVEDKLGVCPGSQFSIPITLRNTGRAASFGIIQSLACNSSLNCSLFPEIGSFDLLGGGSASFTLNLIAPAPGIAQFVAVSAADDANNTAAEGFVLSTATDPNECVVCQGTCDRPPPGCTGLYCDFGTNETPKLVNCSVTVDAPLDSMCTANVMVNVSCDDGKPLAGMILNVTGPDGTQEVIVDSNNQAEYYGGSEGFYVYDMPGAQITSTTVTYVYCPYASAGVKTLIVPLYVTETSVLDMSVFREGRKPNKAWLRILHPNQSINHTNTSTGGTYEDTLITPGKYVFTITATGVKALSAKLELNKMPSEAGLGPDLILLLILLIVLAIMLGYNSRRSIIALLVKKQLVTISFEKKEHYEAGEDIEITFKLKDSSKVAANTAVSILSEDGQEMVLITDAKGRLIFIPDKDGTYHFALADYIIYGDDKVLIGHVPGSFEQAGMEFETGKEEKSGKKESKKE